MANHQNLFNTTEIHEADKPQLQNSKEFPVPYHPARFPLGLNYIDCGKDNNVRAKTYFDNLNYDSKNDKFTAQCHIDAWYDSVMHAAGCTWFPHSHDRDFQSGSVYVEPGTQKWTTVAVKFPQGFASQPKVVSWLRGIDVDKDGDWCLEVLAEDITSEGFNLKFHIWGITKAFWLEASWIAYPADRSNIDSGALVIKEKTDGKAAQKKITFGKEFTRPPVVYCALNRIDESKEKFMRAKTYVTDVTTEGMNVHLDVWDDTFMWSLGCQWLAFQQH